MHQKLPFILIFGIIFALTITGCSNREPLYYSEDDFGRVSKIDVHFHYNLSDPVFLLFADSLNFKILSPNVNSSTPVDEQFAIARDLRHRFPKQFAFFGTFTVDHFGNDEFADEILRQIKEALMAGASGIKIWKNVGMELLDSEGRYVMASDESFDPVFQYLEKNQITLMAHLGEPRSCWLPLEEMDLLNHVRYYTANPQYHMYLHPEAPSYEDQIAVIDELLTRYPDMEYIGAHLASLEWNIDEVAKRLDAHPSLLIEFSARIGHLQHQSHANHQRVRDFLIKYQDRIMYGTDTGVNSRNTNVVSEKERLYGLWLRHWRYLATDSEVEVPELGGEMVKGLQLPREVVDKIYYHNAARYFE